MPTAKKHGVISPKDSGGREAAGRRLEELTRIQISARRPSFALLPSTSAAAVALSFRMLG